MIEIKKNNLKNLKKMGQAFARCCSSLKKTTKGALVGTKRLAKKVFKFTTQGLGKFGRIFRQSGSTRNKAKTDKQIENYNLQDDVYYAPEYFDIKAKIEEKEVKGGFVQSKGEIVYEPRQSPDCGGKCMKKVEFTYTEQIDDQLALDYIQDDLKYNQIITEVKIKISFMNFFKFFFINFFLETYL